MVDKDIAEKVLRIFGEMVEKEEEQKDIRQDTKEMIDLFCEQNDNFTPKQIKAGFAYFKKFNKDRSLLAEDELERDMMIEIIETA